jgi:hypothetical protein
MQCLKHWWNEVNAYEHPCLSCSCHPGGNRDHYCRGQVQAATAAGSQIDRPHRHLRDQSQRVGGRGAKGHDRFSKLGRHAFDHLDSQRRTGAKAALDGQNIRGYGDLPEPDNSFAPERFVN